MDPVFYDQTIVTEENIAWLFLFEETVQFSVVVKFQNGNLMQKFFKLLFMLYSLLFRQANVKWLRRLVHLSCNYSSTYEWINSIGINKH